MNASYRETEPPEIYGVVELPEAEQGDECPLAVGPADDIGFCGQPAKYVFVYERSSKEHNDERANCLACEDCKPGVVRDE